MNTHENDKARPFLQMVQTIPGDTRTCIITECTMTADIDIDLNKAMTIEPRHTHSGRATQLTQFVNLLDRPPDTYADIPIRPPDTDIPILATSRHRHP